MNVIFLPDLAAQLLWWLKEEKITLISFYNTCVKMLELNQNKSDRVSCFLIAI